MEEKISVNARKKKKLSKLVSLLGNLGFSRVDFSENSITMEKYKSFGLDERKNLDYRIIFDSRKIELTYSVYEKMTKNGRLLELLPIFLNALYVAREYYDIDATSLFSPISALFQDIQKIVTKDSIELALELQELTAKFDDVSKKYVDLTRSSEENARILLECERRRDELYKRVERLENLSDEVLKEELYKWIRVHGGTIDISEFCKSYSLTPKRAEEGLELLIAEGYIKKRSE